ncbi:hypothetical protein [Bizionia arctica]|uniref:Tissue inhibitor of metalloproteinase n=1 Tax=Bizionia arctica TaxID=1495645 RepID=A0A917LWW8_9FLAO|nr:hypothetical protein [Bizionia arctica]GGG60687.1 hypothetical protein GCM10010976_34270 [Bizionia arctica]
MKKPIILTIFLLIFSATKVYSCSCEKSSIKYGFEHSDLIFTGTVVEINKKKAYDSIPSSTEKGKYYVQEINRIEFVFKITELIKGKEKSDFITIVTSGGGADCGNYFDLNSEHLIYSYKTDLQVNTFDENNKVEPYFSTDLCTQTKKLNQTKKSEINKLKRLNKQNRK